MRWLIWEIKHPFDLHLGLLECKCAHPEPWTLPERLERSVLAHEQISVYSVLLEAAFLPIGAAVFLSGNSIQMMLF